MEEGQRLLISLEARLTKYEKDMARAAKVANDNFGAIERRARVAGKTLETTMATSTNAMSRQLDNFGTAAAGKLKLAFGAIAAGVSLNELRKAADQYTGIMNSLRVAGVKDNALPQTFDALFASAQRNHVPLEGLAQLYGRVSQAQTTLKASSQEILQVTDIVAQSLRVSGKSASESSGALLQLAQAFSNGKVQAEEYNSLLDGAYPLLQAAAAGLKEAGGEVSTLTALVKDGKVSSEALFRAILAGAPILQDKLAGAVTTSAQAFIDLQNELTKAVGEFDKATGASAGLASAMGTVASSIGPIGQAATDATLKVMALMKALSDLAAASGSALTSALSSAQNSTAATQRAILEAKLRGAIGPERTGIEAQLRALDAGPQNPSAKAARDAAERERYIKAGSDLGDLTKQDTSIGVKNAPQPPARPAGIGGPTVKPVSLADYTVPGGSGGKSGGGGGSGSSEKLDSYERELAKIQKRTEALQQEAKTVGKSTAEIEKSKVALQLEQAARQAGIPVTDSLRSSIDAAATGYANARAEVEKLKQAHEGLKDAGQFVGTQITDGLIDVVVEGKNATEVVQNLAKAFLKAALQAALMGSGPFGSLFGGGGSGVGGGLFGMLAKGIFGFSEGGFTGAGAKHEPAGIVHKGEFVMSKAATSRIGVQNLEAMHRGALRGFADGGFVDAAPIAAPALPSAGVGNVQNMNAVSQSVVVNVQGGSSGNAKQDRDFADQIGKRVQNELRAMIGQEIRQSIRPNGVLREAMR